MSQAVEQALELIRENQPESTDRVLALLQNTVYSFSMKVCGHPQDAEDTMQDVLLKSIPYLAKFDNPQALTVWLYKVARNRCISSHRGARHSPDKNLSLDELMPNSGELQELMKSAAPNPEAALLNSEAAEQLKQAILSVPPLYRMVLVLHDMEELSTAEVARIMDLREGTVRVRLHRARLMVRRELTRLSKALPPVVCRALRLHGRRDRRCGVRGDGPAPARLPALPGVFGEPEERRGPVPLVSAAVRFRARRTAPPRAVAEIPAGARCLGTKGPGRSQLALAQSGCGVHPVISCKL